MAPGRDDKSAVSRDQPAIVVERRPDPGGVLVKTPNGDDVAAFSPSGGIGGWEVVISGEETYAALFFYSGQSSQSYELFQLRPVVTHIGGMPDTCGEGSGPVFSPDERWVAMFMTSDSIVREREEYYEDVWDESATESVVVDWATLYVQHLPELTRHSISVGVEIPLSTDIEIIQEWNTYEAVQFSAPDTATLRMPWGKVLPVHLPSTEVVIGRGFAAPASGK